MLNNIGNVRAIQRNGVPESAAVAAIFLRWMSFLTPVGGRRKKYAARTMGDI